MVFRKVIFHVFEPEHNIAQLSVLIGHKQRHDATAEVGDFRTQAVGVAESMKGYILFHMHITLLKDTIIRSNIHKNGQMSIYFSLS